MWTTITEFISRILANLGIEYLKFRREEIKESDRNNALKAALETEREANEMDHNARIDGLSKWVRKSND